MKPPALSYVARLIAAYGSGAIPPGAVTHLDVRHDTWCPGRLDGAGCVCVPVIEFIDGSELVAIGPRGEVSRRPAR